MLITPERQNHIELDAPSLLFDLSIANAGIAFKSVPDPLYLENH
jgi:hypothetical protein